MIVSPRVLQLAIFVSCCIVFQQSGLAQVGGYPGAYLRNAAGVRAFGLGGAYTAVSDDVSAGYWNAAGLAYINTPQIGAMYSSLSLDRQYNFAAVAWPFGSFGTVNTSWISYKVGNIEARDEFGAVTGAFSNEESAFLLSYGGQPVTGFSLGTTIKVLRHRLANFKATGVGVDIGMLASVSEKFRVGAVLQNVGTHLAWNTPNRTKENWPKTAQLGLSFKPSSFFTASMDYRLRAASSGKFVIDTNNYASWHYGMEFLVQEIFGIRMGYSNGMFVLGASLLVPSSSNMIHIDYGLSADPIDHSQHHKFGILLQFRQKEEPVFPIAKLPAQHKPHPANGKSRTIVKKFRAEIVEISKRQMIVNAGLSDGVADGMILKIYRQIANTFKGKYCGVAKVILAKDHYTLIKIEKTFQNASFKTGEKLALILSE